MQIIINIIAAIFACIGCALVLLATISLARRRFFEPWLDKKLWITAVVLLCAAALAFNPTKSTNREVKQALSTVDMAVRRTAFAKELTITAQKKDSGGEVLAECEYVYTRTQNERHYSLTDAGLAQPWRGEERLSLLEKGLLDTGYGRVDESANQSGYTYRFLKTLKQLSTQKRIVLDNMRATLNAQIPVFMDGKAITEAQQQAMQAQNDAVCAAYDKHLQIYQWEEEYTLDKSGYLSSWQVFCDARDSSGVRVQRYYVFTVTDIEKDR